MTSIWQRIRGRSEPGLTCIQVVELVTDYLEGGLSEADRARFDAHLSGCDGCTNYLDQIRVTIAVVGRVRRGRPLRRGEGRAAGRVPWLGSR